MGRRKVGRGGGGLRRGKELGEGHSPILVHTTREGGSRKYYGELYTIDLEKEQVKECPHALYKDLGFSSIAALGSVIYVFAGHNPGIISMYARTEDEDEEISKNPDLHCYAGSSCLDLNDDSGPGWKPAPPLKYIPIDKCLGDFVPLCGKIYAFGYDNAEVFDPKHNDWDLLLPPPGFNNFNNLSDPVVGDPFNKRIFLRFHSDDKSPLYAYYPNDGRWVLLVEDFKRWTSGGVAFADGVLYFYVDKIRDVIGAAFDVDTKQWLSIHFSSKFDLEITMNRYITFLHLGNGILCLAGYFNRHFNTYVRVVKFRVRRTRSQNVLFTPISFRRYTIPTVCAVSNVIPVS